MGNNTSKTQSDTSSVSEPVYNEKQTYPDSDSLSSQSQITSILRQLNIGDTTSNSTNGINSAEDLGAWESDFNSNLKNSLAQSAIAKNDIYSVIANPSSGAGVQHQYLFNTELKTVGSPGCYNNQASSGRCWMFATSNVLRAHVIKNYNLKPDQFQVSQAYLFFYDKLERANYALDNFIATADEPLDSRYVGSVFSDAVGGDGGQWDMVVNILDKYGIVPHEFFPDNAQAGASSTLNYILKEKLREFGLVLRKLKTQGALEVVILQVKKAMMKHIYNVISICLGTPPKPSDTFTWEFIDKDGKFQALDTTPTDFYKTHVRYEANKSFSLVHDPRNEVGALLTVDKLNNVSGGRPIQYVNTTLDSIKQAAIKMIKADEPVFFGCDVGKFYDRQTGVLDVDQYDFGLAFGSGFNVSKKERLQTGSSAMTHAMTLTGVHLDKAGRPVRWKIENSWGDAVGDKGYFVMTDKWFDEFVFQVVTSKAYASKEDYATWKSQEYTVLPFFDPMGALA
ncbi:peptidase C1B, bleomycin hydrolase [Yamadazyma tenuis ATCC 10573]|uniref:Cysteine proteinase 1, mitochondrial n=1 Tax=Candida tenuis (strain ATCC 10573 / BCRC 21748 / CBS 615 / JCM 9827 / NBRC 10315 / NRRL Y-1498 / VKM Y-70) TaxID=590646 RepID=G3BC57_CANTC|nr:peptidase C1B, bleomycin hydrolase [Yamadazyma tenuis ATCC 10573]EGV60124.1 peptidase C1B, bleomycin hydrolase [Yamadazyma tenuis ATCC 10573]